MRGPLSAETLSTLIGSIYDCVLEPERWPQTLQHIRCELDFANAALTMHALPSGEVLLNVWDGPDQIWIDRASQYGADVIEQWGGIERIRTYPIGEPLVQSRMTDRSTWSNCRFTREWGRPQGIHDLIGIFLACDPTSFGGLGLGRHVSAGEIGELEVEAARLLAPHLLRAVTISGVLDAKSIAASAFESALDGFTVGIVLTDADLGIVHANAAATAMLSAHDPICSDHGRLKLRPPAAITAALGAAVRQAAADEAGMGRRGLGVPITRSDGSPCVLHVLPLRQGALRAGLRPRAAAAIFVVPDTPPPTLPVNVLATLFDLTGTEARVFAEIASGKTKLETATRLNIERTTVKTHLSHIFLKTGARRQADLITLAAALALPLRP